MSKKILLLTSLFCGIYAGDQSHISMKRYSPQRGDSAKRGKKRNQACMPTLEVMAAGPDVQLGQKDTRHMTSSERRDRARARKELVLLDWATKPGSAEQKGAVAALLQAGINPNMPFTEKCGISFFSSPLCNAAHAGNKELVKLLLEHQANPDEERIFSNKKKHIIMRPLHVAARARKERNAFEGYYPEVISLLHDYKADMNAGGEVEALPFAPIHIAVLQRKMPVERQLAVLQALVACDADPLVESFYVSTPVQLATRRNRDEAAAFLRAAATADFAAFTVCAAPASSSGARPEKKSSFKKAKRFRTRHRKSSKQLMHEQCD